MSELVNIFPKKLIRELLPPFFRKPKRIAFIQVALSPLNKLLRKTLEIANDIERNLTIPPTQENIENALKEKYGATVFNEGDIGKNKLLLNDPNKDRVTIVEELDRLMISGKKERIPLYKLNEQGELCELIDDSIEEE